MAEDVRGIGTGTLPVMLFMVIERFKGGNPKPIGERFRRDGRMLPRALCIRPVGWARQAPVVSRSWRRPVLIL